MSATRSARRHAHRAAARCRLRPAGGRRRGLRAVRGDDGRPAVVGRRARGVRSACWPSAASSRCPIRRSSTRPGSQDLRTHWAGAESRLSNDTEPSRGRHGSAAGLDARSRRAPDSSSEPGCERRRDDAAPTIDELTLHRSSRGCRATPCSSTVGWHTDSGRRHRSAGGAARARSRRRTAVPRVRPRTPVPRDGSGGRELGGAGPALAWVRTRCRVRRFRVHRDGTGRRHRADRHPSVHLRRRVGGRRHRRRAGPDGAERRSRSSSACTRSPIPARHSRGWRRRRPQPLRAHVDQRTRLRRLGARRSVGPVDRTWASPGSRTTGPTRGRRC